MRLMHRIWIFLICVLFCGFFFLKAAPGQPQIQTIQKPRPTIMGFSAEICPMCKYMEKALKQLKARYGDQIEIRILHYHPDDKLFKKYKVVFVPTLVFLDASGKEVFRQTGVSTQYELAKKLKELKLIQDRKGEVPGLSKSSSQANARNV